MVASFQALGRVVVIITYWGALYLSACRRRNYRYYRVARQYGLPFEDSTFFITDIRSIRESDWIPDGNTNTKEQ
jgi:hypothetical protein